MTNDIVDPKTILFGFALQLRSLCVADNIPRYVPFNNKRREGWRHWAPSQEDWGLLLATCDLQSWTETGPPLGGKAWLSMHSPQGAHPSTLLPWPTACMQLGLRLFWNTVTGRDFYMLTPIGLSSETLLVPSHYSSHVPLRVSSPKGFTMAPHACSWPPTMDCQGSGENFCNLKIQLRMTYHPASYSIWFPQICTLSPSNHCPETFILSCQEYCNSFFLDVPESSLLALIPVPSPSQLNYLKHKCYFNTSKWVRTYRYSSRSLRAYIVPEDRKSVV